MTNNNIVWQLPVIRSNQTKDVVNMKKTCNGCKAFGYIVENECALGHKIKLKYYDTVFVIGAKPLEECEKPKTNYEMYRLKGKINTK
ncbi:hypothetical protein MOC47_08390 [Bacillus spizizenii]|nr:hypothetical protein [Bacillus spizizenii]